MFRAIVILNVGADWVLQVCPVNCICDNGIYRYDVFEPNSHVCTEVEYQDTDYDYREVSCRARQSRAIIYLVARPGRCEFRESIDTTRRIVNNVNNVTYTPCLHGTGRVRWRYYFFMFRRCLPSSKQKQKKKNGCRYHVFG